MKIAVLEAYSLSAVSRLSAQPGVVMTKDIKEAEIALIRSRIKIDTDFLNQAAALKLVITSTSGFDHIDWRECVKRGITVAHTPEANAHSTAELTMALILASERQLLKARQNVRDNHWREGLTRPMGLQGQALGIVGLGRVGRQVCNLARAFGMIVSAYDPYIDDKVFESHHVERTSFIELLKASDYVSLHVPLTKETKHFLNNATFKEMQGEAVLINTCRGPVVDENDLLSALDEGMIKGAAMDVIEREPPPKGHRVLTHPKLLLTPHIGAFTDNAWDMASHEAVEKALRFIKGQPVLDTLPIAAPWFEKT